jgi:Rieske Fe-S protein
VLASNVPGPLAWNGLYLKQAAYRTYVVGLGIEENEVANALYWDTHDPYHYVRLARHQGRQVLLVGGEDHKTGQRGASDERFEKLIEWTRYVFPQAKEEVVRWSGQVQETGDGLGFIGRAPGGGECVYCITGDSGMGLTHGTLGAMLVTDLIQRRASPWEDIYSPTRKLLNKDVISEAANANAQYTDYLTPGEIASEDDLRPGEGGLMRSGLKKLALYRDESGKVHRMSAVCPHLKCIVHWNPVERSWDCPCHGSRFDCQGHNVIGPAVSDLDKA